MVGITSIQDITGKMDKSVYDVGVTGKVDAVNTGGIIAHSLLKKASANVRHGVEDGSDEAQHSLDETLTVVKTFTFTNGLKGGMRLKEELKTDNLSYKLRCRWYHDAVAIGTEHTGDLLDTYDQQSEDVAVDVAAGETLVAKVICVHGTSYPLNYIKNVQVCYDNDIDAVAAS